MSSSACPPRNELAAFALGELSESALEAILKHIENCPTCDRTLQELDQLSDPVIAGLRRSGPAPTSPVSAYSPPPSGRLGDYELLREVGRGGMGVVYEAKQVGLGRRVALKVLLPHALLDASWVERFRREARSAGRLHHTNIVPIHEAGEANGLRYFAMQFIAGAGLNTVIRQLRRTVPAAEGAPSTAEPSFPDSLGTFHGRPPCRFAGGPGIRARRYGQFRTTASGLRSRVRVAAAHLLGERGPRGDSGRRGAPVRSFAGRPSPRRQALEPTARRRRHLVGQ